MITAQDVCRFLEKQPDFFVDHPELLEALHVPHRTDGQTVSLVERQVKVLRANQAETRQRLATLIRNARDNEALVGHMHRLALRLIAAKIAAPAGAPTALEQLAPLVEAAMREDFGVSPARLLAPAAVPKSLRSTLLASGSPHCGRLREDDRHALLGAVAEGVGSMALVQLGAGAAQGLLVLGSADTVHFHPGMATDFLTRIAQLLSTALAAATVAPAAPT